MSKPAQAPDTIPASTACPPEPITALAKRGSNQLSLEQPQNKAGKCASRSFTQVGLPVSKQNTSYRHWTKLSTGHAKVQYGQ